MLEITLNKTINKNIMNYIYNYIINVCYTKFVSFWKKGTIFFTNTWG